MNSTHRLRRLVCLATLAGWLTMTVLQATAQEKPKQAPPPKNKRPEAASPDQIERWRQSIALVEGKRGHGSGFVVRPGIVVTNSNVIEDEFLGDVGVRF